MLSLVTVDSARSSFGSRCSRTPVPLPSRLLSPDDCVTVETFPNERIRIRCCQGGILCDEMGLGKTAATLALHLVNPAKTPADGVPLDEGEWGPIVGKQVKNRAFKERKDTATKSNNI